MAILFVVHRQEPVHSKAVGKALLLQLNEQRKKQHPEL
jgi:hypothetical protein